MTTQIMVSGVGGQGVLFFGRLLTETAMLQYKHVSFFPNYGGLVRGGESECTIVLSDSPIGSPITTSPEVGVAMSALALRQLETKVRSGGVLLVDRTLATAKVARDDIRLITMPATELATEMGDKMAANLILLGALVKLTGVVRLDAVESQLERRMQGKGRDELLQSNKAALRIGAAATKMTDGAS